MSIGDLEMDLLATYRELHAGLEGMIAGGRLTEGTIPDDYQWLTEMLTRATETRSELARAVADEACGLLARATGNGGME